jgi:hypothetical protein
MSSGRSLARDGASPNKQSHQTAIFCLIVPLQALRAGSAAQTPGITLRSVVMRRPQWRVDSKIEEHVQQQLVEANLGEG